MKKLKVLILFIAILRVGYSEGKPHGKPLPKADCVCVFSPHPDDDIIGCGGAIAEHRASGSDVVIVYMTSGEAHRPKEAKEIAQKREREAQRAADKLGVHELIFLREPDGKLQMSDQRVSRIAELLADIQPDLIYIPHQFDGHKDHKATHAIVVKAAQKVAKAGDFHKIPFILAYEVWTPLVHITHRLDISDTIHLKLAALKEHKSQISSIDYVEAVKGLNRYRGILICRSSYGECFQQIPLR